MTKPRSDTHARIPALDIAARLAARAEDLCRHLLPEGRREGSEWRCGSVQGVSLPTERGVTVLEGGAV